MMREDWVEIRFDELISNVSTSNNKVKQREYLQKGLYPVIDQGQELIGGYIDDEEKIVECNLPVIVFGDHTKIVKYINFKFAPGADGTKILEPKRMVEPKYLYYVTKFVAKKIEDRGYARHYQYLRKESVFVAPAPEQRAIVAKIEELFSELDSGIDSLKKARKQLEVYKQAVLKAAFEGKLTKEWRKENNYSIKYLEKIKEDINEFNLNKKGQDIPRRLPTVSFDELPEIPFGWLWVEAHKVCQSVRDGTHDTPKYEKTGIPLVTSKNLKDGDIDLENVSYISISDHREISKRSKVEEKDILFGMIGTIGSPVIVKEDNIFSIKNVGLFKKNEKLIKSRYLYYYLSSWFSKKIMSDKELIRGTTQKFISLGGLRMLPTPLPLIDEQEEIIKEIESRLSVCENIEANIEEVFEKAEALRHSILKKAFEGKLLSKEELEACKQEDDWEPAEKLLKRIKEVTKEAK